MAFEHLLSPVTLRGKTLKSRILSSKCNGFHVTYEADRAHYVSIARAGAASVVMSPGDYPSRCREFLPDGRPARKGSGINLENEADREALKKVIDAIHAEGSLVSMSMMDIEPGFYGIADVPNFDAIPSTGDYSQMLFEKPGATLEQLEWLLDEFVFRAKDAYALGADIVSFYMCYRVSILAQSLSPLYNYRTDQYGGKTMEERASLTMELFRRLREACPDLIIEIQISAEEEAGYTLEDFKTYCRMVDGLVDIIEARGYDGSATHVNGMLAEPHMLPNLRYAEAVKSLQLKHTLVAPVGGFGNPEDIDRWIAEGKTDLVTMARRYLADFDYGRKLSEDRVADIVPCLLCNKCHAPTPVCSVNPIRDNPKAYPPAEKSKKVAILGGGAAGLRAAIYAAERGHAVTIFEASNRLGGQLIQASAPSFKWPIKQYLDYLLYQVEKNGIEVRLNTPASPENVVGFDAVIAALGSAPKQLPVPGSENAVTADRVYGHEDELGQKVIIIGGADTGRETALHLAEKGLEVTMLTRKQAKYFGDNHAQRIEEETWHKFPNLHCVDFCSTLEIGKDYVVCDVKHGVVPQVQGFAATGLWGLGFNVTPEVPATMPPANSSMDMSGPFPRIVPPDESNATVTRECFTCDTVVISGGREPRDAELFRNLAPEFYVIGDGEKPGEIMQTVKDAYAVAMAL